MLEHTALLNERIANWTVGGHDVHIEAQNRFELRGRTATLAGRPDIIARREDHAVIVDAKTGHDSPSHAVQVMIYLYAIPKAIERYRSLKLRGQVTYRDHTVRISAEAVDDQFIQNLGALIRRLSADEPARRVPSGSECRFCDISAVDCPEGAWTTITSPRTAPPTISEGVKPQSSRHVAQTPGERHVQTNKGGWKGGFSKTMVPNAGDGDGNGVVCEKRAYTHA